MTAKKISELAAASALAGTETLPVVQGGTTKAATAQQIADLVVLSSYATQSYVDAALAGLSWKQAVRAATTAALTLATDLENGDTLDGVALATGDRVLVKNQGSGAENGIYIVAASGAPTRASDANSGAELVNASVYVSEGTVNADTQWTCTTNATITVGSTSLAWAQLSAGVSDASAITYTPADTSKWNGSTDPGDVDEALDQLASRTKTLESAGSGDAASVTYTPVDATDWNTDTDPGNVDDALDQLADRVNTIEASGGGGSTGKQLIGVVASAMTPRQTNGCANHAWLVGASNQPDVPYLAFDASTIEYAEFAIPMPKAWNEGTITFAPIWTHPATTTNFGVVWKLEAVAVSDGDALAATFGTGQTSTDTGGATSTQYVGPESSAITVGGTPAASDTVFFRLSRVASDGSDTLAVDAYLIGVRVFFTTDASNEA